MKLLENVIIGVMLTAAMIMVMAFYNARHIKQTHDRQGLGPIVRLVVQGRTFCSGTVVNETTIITAGHCIAMDTPLGPMINPNPIEIRASDNIPRGHMGRVNYASGQMDHAILKGDFRQFKPKFYITDVAELNKTLVAGRKLISCGYPLNGPLHCSNMVYTDKIYFFGAATGLLLPGMSGGPTMTEDGTEVGINDAVEGNKSVISPIYNLNYHFNDVLDR